MPIRGVARLNDGENRLGLALVNLENRQDGEYFLLFGKKILKIENLSGQDFFDVYSNESDSLVAIIFYDKKTVLPVATGSFSLQKINLEEIINYAKKHFKICDQTEKKTVVFQDENYNDEAIADTNYYEFETVEKRGNDINERAVDNKKLNYSQNSTQKEEKEEFFIADEPISASNSQFEQEQTDFYSKIKVEIENLFKNYPKEENLCNMVEDSKWVKIGDGEKHYAVGLIFKNSQPEYICYGLPGCFSKRQERRTFSFFIPISPFDLKGEGYWVSFQSAKNGKCIE